MPGDVIEVPTHTFPPVRSKIIPECPEFVCLFVLSDVLTPYAYAPPWTPLNPGFYSISGGCRDRVPGVPGVPRKLSGVPGVPSNYSGVPGLECIDFRTEFPDFFGVPGVLGVLRNFSEVLRNTWSALSAQKLFRSARSAQKFHRSARTAVVPGMPRNFSRVPGVPRNFSGVS